MTLRARVALLIGAVVVIAVALSSGTAYVVSERRLNSEVNRFVVDRARQVAQIRPGAGGADRRGNRQIPGQGTAANQNASGTGSDAVPVFRPPLLDGLPLAGLDTVTQLLDPTGQVVATVGIDTDARLPVADVDRLISGGASGAVRTVSVGSVRYRMATEPFGRGGAVQVARSLGETDRVLHTLRLRYLVIGLSGTALAVLGVWFVVRRSTRPIEQLAFSAEQIALTQDLSVPVEVTGPGEVKKLASSFNSMLRALARSRSEQQRLVQDAGHELRTPLTSLRTNIDVLTHFDRLDANDRSAVIADLRAEAVELSTLVDELVDLATDHRRSEVPEPLVLSDLVTDIIDRAQRRSGRSIHLESIAELMVTVRRSQAERAVGNLIDNALKYSAGPVEVLVRGGRLEVSDHGPGFEEASLPQVFDRFWRSDSARSTPGSGLGLAIVARFAEDHNGTVFADNAEGGGAVVGFEVPTSGQPETEPLADHTSEPIGGLDDPTSVGSPSR